MWGLPIGPQEGQVQPKHSCCALSSSVNCCFAAAGACVLHACQSAGHQLKVGTMFPPCSCEWTRRKTKSDAADWLYLPTIYPADSLVTLKRR